VQQHQIIHLTHLQCHTLKSRTGANSIKNLDLVILNHVILNRIKGQMIQGRANPALNEIHLEMGQLKRTDRLVKFSKSILNY